MTPQETVERALGPPPGADDCIVIADETSTAKTCAGPANSLTTNGVARSRQLTVIAESPRGARAARRPAWLSRGPGCGADQVAGRRCRGGGRPRARVPRPRDGQEPLLGPGDPEAVRCQGGFRSPASPGWDDEPGRHRHRRVHELSRQLSGEAFRGRGKRPGGSCTGYAEHSLTSNLSSATLPPGLGGCAPRPAPPVRPEHQPPSRPSPAAFRLGRPGPSATFHRRGTSGR